MLLVVDRLFPDWQKVELMPMLMEPMLTMISSHGRNIMINYSDGDQTNSPGRMILAVVLPPLDRLDEPMRMFH